MPQDMLQRHVTHAYDHVTLTYDHVHTQWHSYSRFRQFNDLQRAPATSVSQHAHETGLICQLQPFSFPHSPVLKFVCTTVVRSENLQPYGVIVHKFNYYYFFCYYYYYYYYYYHRQLSCPVLFFSLQCPARTVRPIFALDGSNGVVQPKHGPFWVRTMSDIIWGKCAPKKPQKGRE